MQFTLHTAVKYFCILKSSILPWRPSPQQLWAPVFRCGRSRWFRSFLQAWLSSTAISLWLRLSGGRCKMSPETDVLCLTFTRLKAEHWRRDSRPEAVLFSISAVAASSYEICLILNSRDYPPILMDIFTWNYDSVKIKEDCTSIKYLSALSLYSCYFVQNTEKRDIRTC